MKSICIGVLMALMFFVPIHTREMIIGTIQFPKTITNIPVVRIRYSGEKIKYEKDEQSKKIFFKIPKNKNQAMFHMLITESVQFVTKKHAAQQNTIAHIKVTHKPYKLYAIEYIPASENKNQKSYWDIIEKQATNGMVPDDTIIVRYPAQYVDTLHIESSFELPTIIIKDNILELAGSATNLAELSDKLLLASIDADTVHTEKPACIKRDTKRIILAAPVA